MQKRERQWEILHLFFNIFLAQLDCSWFVLLRLKLLPPFLFAFFLGLPEGKLLVLSSSEYFVCSVVYSEFFLTAYQDVGRMKMELFADVVPKTAENFR